MERKLAWLTFHETMCLMQLAINQDGIPCAINIF